jgi:hypothetical protein
MTRTNEGFYMIEFLQVLIFLTLIFGAYYSYHITGDSLHPMVVLSPFLGYIYGYRPLLLHWSEDVYRYISRSDYEFVCLVNFIFLFAFALGCSISTKRCRFNNHFEAICAVESKGLRQAAAKTGFILGSIAFLVFWHSIWYNGGPLAVFSQNKPFLISPIGIGYYNELPMLTFPALIFLAIAWQNQPLNFQRILVILVVASPQLAWGTFGGRRGPAFIIACTLAFVFLTLRKTKVKAWNILFAAIVIGITLIALTSMRGDLFRFGMQTDALAKVKETIFVGTASEGDEVVYAASQIINAERYDLFQWGRRYFTLFFIRPIPSILFPNKYETFGMSWMVDSPGSLGYSAYEWQSMQGFSVALGSAGGLISDLYLEFWWFGSFACFLLGMLLAFLRSRSLNRGGVWTMIFLMSSALSIYLPTQSVEAWGYRLLLISALLLIFWEVQMKGLWQIGLNGKGIVKGLRADTRFR